MVDRDSVVGKTEDAIEPANQIRPGSRAWKSCTYLPNANAKPGSFVASAKSWCLMLRSPIFKVSWDTKPSIEPEPYWIENSVPFTL